MMRHLLGAATACAVLFGAGLASAQEVTIRYSSWLPETHWYVGGYMIPYLRRIEEATEGRVKVEVLPKVVGSPAAQFDVVRDGLADMSWIVLGYTPGRFKAAQFGELPFSAIQKPEHARAYHEIYWKHFADLNEFAGVEVMAMWNITGINIATKRKPVNSADDLRGLKLRAASDLAARSLELMGAVPIIKSSTEAFEMLSTGAIDGSLMLMETPLSTNALPLLDHYTIVPGGVASSLHAMILNPAKWAEISAGDQERIRAISGAVFSEIAGGAYFGQDAVGLKAMQDAGYTITTASDAMMADLRERLQPIEDSWIEMTRAAGAADPAAALAEYRAALAQ